MKNYINKKLKIMLFENRLVFFSNETPQQYTELQTTNDGNQEFNDILSSIDAQFNDKKNHIGKEKTTNIKQLKDEKDKRIQELNANIGGEPDKKNQIQEHTKWENNKKEIENKILQLNTDFEEKQKEIENKANEKIYEIDQLKDTAINNAKTAFYDAKAQAEVILSREINSISKYPDDETLEEVMKTAEYAEALADDGNLNILQGRVSDYHDSQLEGRIIKDSELENLTMGIVASMHNPNTADDDKNPAESFINGLSDREKKKGGVFSFRDTGVNASDVQLQILQTIGFNLDDKDNRDLAKESKAGKLVTKLMTDDKLPPELRGMMLGELAKSNENNREEQINILNRMFEQSKAQIQQFQQSAEDINMPGHSAEALARVGGVGALAVVVASIPLASLGLSAWAIANHNELDDRKRLTVAGLAFQSMKDAQTEIEFENMKAEYETLKSTNFNLYKSVNKDKEMSFDYQPIENILSENTTPAGKRRTVKNSSFRDALNKYRTFLAQSPQVTDTPVKKSQETTGPQPNQEQNPSNAPSASSTPPASPTRSARTSSSGGTIQGSPTMRSTETQQSQILVTSLPPENVTNDFSFEDNKPKTANRINPLLNDSKWIERINFPPKFNLNKNFPYGIVEHNDKKYVVEIKQDKDTKYSVENVYKIDDNRKTDVPPSTNA